MNGKRLVILLSLLLCDFGYSFAQINTKTFNWTDTTFEAWSKRHINVSFKPDSSNLNSTSKKVCDTIVAFMQKNKNLQIGINCHIDQLGDYYQDIKLTNERAKSISDYCTANGIDSLRLVPKGWGYHKGGISITPIKKATTKQDSAYQRYRGLEVEILDTHYKK